MIERRRLGSIFDVVTGVFIFILHTRSLDDDITLSPSAEENHAIMLASTGDKHKLKIGSGSGSSDGDYSIHVLHGEDQYILPIIA